MRAELAAVVVFATGGAGEAAARAAHVCDAGKLLCATAMPVGGYCECTASSGVQDGTVVPALPPGGRINATAGGCGTHPTAPGC